MPIYKNAQTDLAPRAQALLSKFESHRPLLDCHVKLDFLFAYCDRDEDTDEPLNDAIKHHGQRALGLARKTSVKERAKGHGDAEILIDGDWWATAPEPEQDALLDHELHHLAIKITKGVIQVDSAGRPQLKLRKHDVEVGWFKTIADRHGRHSQEQIQARTIADALGQYFWPQLCGEPDRTVMTISTGGKSVTVTGEQLSKAASRLKRAAAEARA